MKQVVWIHGDCLSPYGPALEQAPDAPALFVWDDALLAEWQISLKRIVFIYECLLSLPVTIRRGDVAEQLAAFVQEHEADTVVTTESPSPRFAQICTDLRARGLTVEILDIEPFVVILEAVDLKRFSRYWRKAIKHL